MIRIEWEEIKGQQQLASCRVGRHANKRGVGGRREKQQVRMQKNKKLVTSDQSDQAEHHTYTSSKKSVWIGVDWLVAKGKKKAIGCFQCKMENKRSVELVIKAVYFKGLHRVSYLLRHKSPAGQKCPFINLPQMNQASEYKASLRVLEDLTKATAAAILLNVNTTPYICLKSRFSQQEWCLLAQLTTYYFSGFFVFVLLFGQTRDLMPLNVLYRSNKKKMCSTNVLAGLIAKYCGSASTYCFI